MESRTAVAPECGSNSSIPRLTLSLDSSSCFVSSSNVISELPEDKRKILEERLIKNPHAKNVVETMVGFGENSRDKIYFMHSGAESSKDLVLAHHESIPDRAPASGNLLLNDRSRDAPIIFEGSRDKQCMSNYDKSYIPGAPVTPNKPCVNAALVEVASRSVIDNVIPVLASESHSGVVSAVSAKIDKSTVKDALGLRCYENMSSIDQVNQRRVSCNSISSSQKEGLDLDHFSAEELDSTDEEDSRGSASSAQRDPASNSQDDDDCPLQSVERKRKLFASDDAAGEVTVPSTSYHGDAKPTIQYERLIKKSSRVQSKRCRNSHDSIGSEGLRTNERSPPKTSRNTITHFFAPTATNQTTPLGASDSTHFVDKERDLARRETELDARERLLAERERDVQRREAQQARFEEEAMQRVTAVAREERAAAESRRQQHDMRVVEVLRSLVVARAREERSAAATRLSADMARVGRVSFLRSGMSFSEVWEDGIAWSELARRGEELETEDARLERDKKAFVKRCKSSSMAVVSTGAGAVQGMQPPAIPSDEQAEQEEIFRLRAAKLRDRKKAHVEEREKLEREKYSLMRELKRSQDQARSKYNNFPVLHGRYLLIHLLGKGGFSEVYRAFDLKEMQEVACKLHELNSQWSQEKKANYMRHATRECEIQKQLCHPRIVRLLDVFELSADCFCTVLEFCDGGDLEQVLKAQRTLPEREARSIMVQIFKGLRYLNEQPRRVIHYDLKPANIIFHGGDVKISDFGLSKVMDESDGGAMELTSQGAGTYWYLPPECFEIGHSPPKISSKVDVWSAGVIFFQMLFGVKPFGHGMSQEKMLMEQTITRSTCVNFPEGKDVPKVSDKAKEFIRRCLSYHQSDRPDVLAIFLDPYLRHTGRQASSAACT